MKIRVLVLDDEPSICDLLKISLDTYGMETTVCNDGTEAVRLFSSARVMQRGFDVVILDLSIPGGKGGLETFREMRALDETVVSIASSGYFDEQLEVDLRTEGFQSFLPKPYNVEELVRQLRQLTGRKY